MRILDFPHQHRILAPGTYIEQWRIPCEGSSSLVEGQIIITAKDYTNQPTFSACNIDFLNSVYHMMPNAEINFAATFAGVGVVPATTFKDSDIGTPILGKITRGGELVTITITATVVPDPFMLYIRPLIKVTGLPEVATTPVEKAKGSKIELPFTPVESSIPFTHDSADPVMHQVSGIDVVKYNRKR